MPRCAASPPASTADLKSGTSDPGTPFSLYGSYAVTLLPLSNLYPALPILRGMTEAPQTQAQLSELAERLRGAHQMTRELLSDVIGETCFRFPPVRRTEGAARIEQWMTSGAWTDAVLALISLELPQWRIRRIVYDEGEWHCALSRQRELPDWLDEAVEFGHAELPLAILGAFVSAQALGTSTSGTSVPSVAYTADPLSAPLCCDNLT